MPCDLEHKHVRAKKFSREYSQFWKCVYSYICEAYKWILNIVRKYINVNFHIRMSSCKEISRNHCFVLLHQPDVWDSKFPVFSRPIQVFAINRAILSKSSEKNNHYMTRFRLKQQRNFHKLVYSEVTWTIKKKQKQGRLPERTDRKPPVTQKNIAQFATT